VSGERRSLPAVVEAAAPVRATVVGRHVRVPAMIANLGDHTGDEITLEEVEWITI
jgi:hypothetical protein